MKNLIIAAILLITVLSSCKESDFYIIPIHIKPSAREVWRPREFKIYNDPQFDVRIITCNGKSVQFMFTNHNLAQTVSSEQVTDFVRTYDRIKLAGMVCILQRRHSKITMNQCGGDSTRSSALYYHTKLPSL
jgi:hypothetical protein